MANLIYSCWRRDAQKGGRELLERVAARITPESLRGHEPRVAEGPDECLCLTGPNRGVAMVGCSARLGAFTGPAPDWHLPGTPEPDGTYALVRSDAGTVEAWCHEAGTRTLWYVFEPDRLLVSSSQRALVCLLQDLDWNPAAFAWFLGSGLLGPTDAWDRRIRRLPRGAHLALDRRTWTLDLHTRPVRLAPRRMGEAEARQGILDALTAVMRDPAILPPTWLLPLSGGNDSRTLLSLLHRTGLQPRTVTWGMAASRAQRGNDAFVAEQLARHFGVRNDYLVTESADASPRDLADAFLQASGGTNDTLFPYLDGLKLWNDFVREGVDGILRGDQGFGTPPRPARHHRFFMCLIPLWEFLAPADAEAIADGRQALPEELLPEPGETTQTYADRLSHSYLAPVGLASLNDVKAPFLEVASPMLAGSVLAFARQLPDRFRADRSCYRRVVWSLSPPIPIATMAADDIRNNFLAEPRFRDWIGEELESDFCRRALPEHLRLDWQAAVRRNTATLMESSSLRAAIKRVIPRALVGIAKSMLPPDPATVPHLAFRAALASRLERLLRADAGHLARTALTGGPAPPTMVPEIHQDSDPVQHGRAGGR